MYTPKEYCHADALSLGNEAKQRGRKIFALKLLYEFLILLAVGQPFSTYKDLPDGGVNVPNLMVFSHWVKCPCPFTFGERDYSFYPW